MLVLALMAVHADQSLVGLSSSDVRFSHERGLVDVSFARIDGLSLGDSMSVTLRAHGSHITHLECVGGDIASVDASGAELGGSGWRAVRIETADFRNADLKNAAFLNLRFGRCTFDGAKLIGTRFRGVQADDCTFRGATFDRTSALPFGTKDALRRGMIYVD